MSWVRLKQRKSQINVWRTTAVRSLSIMCTVTKKAKTKKEKS